MIPYVSKEPNLYYYDAKDLRERKLNGKLRNKPLKPISQKRCQQSVKPSAYYYNLLDFATKQFR